MREKTFAARRRVKVKNERLGQGEMPGYYVAIIDSDLGVLREYLEEMEQAYEEVHFKKGGTIDAQFIRIVLQEKICNEIKSQSAAIQGYVTLKARGKRFLNLSPVLRHLNSEINNLEIEFRKKYEIEIGELALEAEWKNNEASAQMPTSQASGSPAAMSDVEKTAEPSAKRGPKVKMDRHRAIAEVMKSHGPNWTEPSVLEQIANELDKLKISTSPAWARRERRARTWKRAVEYYPDVVRKALDYSLEMAAKDTNRKPSQTLANPR